MHRPGSDLQSHIRLTCKLEMVRPCIRTPNDAKAVPEQTHSESGHSTPSNQSRVQAHQQRIRYSRPEATRIARLQVQRIGSVRLSPDSGQEYREQEGENVGGTAHRQCRYWDRFPSNQEPQEAVQGPPPSTG